MLAKGNYQLRLITSDWARCTGDILSRQRVGIQALAMSG